MTDVKFTCKLCKLYETASKQSLITHLQRKKICSTSTEFTREFLINELVTKEYNTVTFDCIYCKKKFNHRSNRSKHTKICKQKNANGASSSTTPNTTHDESDNDDDNVDTNIVVDAVEFEQMKKEMMDMKKTIEALIAHAPHTIIHTTNYTPINVAIQNNTTINAYGNEKTEHLTHDFLSHCLLNPSKGLPSLIENIHYNKEFPENHNLRCKSLKQNIFEKYVDSEWRECDASNTLDELIRKGYRILNAHYMEHIMNDPSVYEDENRIKMYERFRFLADNTCNPYHAVKRELRILVKDRTVYVLSSPDENVGSTVDTQ